jgi:hypothetical protein
MTGGHDVEGENVLQRRVQLAAERSIRQEKLVHYLAEVGKRNFFFSPQSQFRNLKEALPQSQFRNF